MNPAEKLQAEPDRYHGFTLESVCWGYRETFRETIEGLFAEGAIGPEKKDVTEAFFNMLKSADRSCFDYLLKEFLGALTPRTRWMLDLPAVFSDVTDMGRRLAEHRLYYGIRFFKHMGEGGFGETPEAIRNLLSWMRRLMEISDEAALAFLEAYPALLERLEFREIERFVRQGTTLFARNAPQGANFLALKTRGAKSAVQALTRECILEDVRSSIETLVHALAGMKVEISDLGGLDSDELHDRNASFVCMYRWMYLPARIRYYPNETANRNRFFLQAVTGAAFLLEKGFPHVHGRPEYASARSLVYGDLTRMNLFQVLEYSRVLKRMLLRWPGIRGSLRQALKAEIKNRPPGGDPEKLLYDALLEVVFGEKTPAAGGTSALEHIDSLLERAAELKNVFETAETVNSDNALSAAALDIYPRLGHRLLAAVSFLPDMYYEAVAEPHAGEKLVADLKNTREKKTVEDDQAAGEEAEAVVEKDEADGDGSGQKQHQPADTIDAAYLYDEWSQPESDYLENHCMLREYPVRPEHVPGWEMEKFRDGAQQVRRMFERLKPDLSAWKKRLEDGDRINTEHLVQYVIDSRIEPSPKVDFYERYAPRERDLAVLVLLDVSGSTAETVGETDASHVRREMRVIEIIRRAALIFGQGLAALGDKFSVCGFSGNGREDCRYFVFKDFSDPWDREAVGRIYAARPLASTRIGPALRHSGGKLESLTARRRLVILVTDGKPMDSGYSPETRYAQYDVRMACEENRKQGVFTLGISTGENTVADMEVMFPQRRFAILPDIRKLPALLPRLYLKLTF